MTYAELLDADRDRPALATAGDPLSVGDLTDYLKALFEEDPCLRQVWVVGEVSSAKAYPSGLYFTLQDPKAKAAVNAVAWRNVIPKLAALPEPGEQVLVLAQARFYAARGQCQLVVWQVLPAGEGLQALRYRQLRDRLAAEGLFDSDRKRSLPHHPQTVAVVTSPQAAAWGDIQRTLRERYPGLHVLFSPALVQGDLAPEAAIAALERVVWDGRAEVIVLARGGGAVEDLACFNDERLVRAIAACPIPVVTGIGHQRDESLADLAADCCAHTPTAAAQTIVPDLEQLREDLDLRSAALLQAMQKTLTARRDRLDSLWRQLYRLHPERQVEGERTRLRALQRRAIAAIQLRYQTARHHQALLSQTLRALNPANVLSRGYAIVRQQEGSIVSNAANVAIGETLDIQWASGRIQVRTIACLPEDADDCPSAGQSA